MDGEWIYSATPYPPNGLDEIFDQHLPSEQTAVTDLDQNPPVDLIGDCAPSMRRVLDETMTNTPCELPLLYTSPRASSRFLRLALPTSLASEPQYTLYDY